MPPGGQAHIQHVLRRTALVPHPYGQDVLSRGGRGELPRDPIPPQLSSAPTRVGSPSPCSKDLQQTLHTSVRRGDGQMCTMPMVLKCAFKHVWQPEFCTAHCGAYCFTRTVAVGWHPLKKMRHRARLLTRVLQGPLLGVALLHKDSGPPVSIRLEMGTSVLWWAPPLQRLRASPGLAPSSAWGGAGRSGAW